MKKTLVILFMSSLVYSATYIDNFTGSDESPIATNWSTVNYYWCNLVNHKVIASANFSQCLAYYDAGSFANNQFSQINLCNYANGATYPAARIQIGANSCYYANCSYGVLKLFKMVAGTETEIATKNVSWASNDSVRVECDGTTIRAIRNRSDTVTATGQSDFASGVAGIYCYYNTDSCNNWRGGDLESCTPATITRHATILDTVGSVAKKYGHAITGTADSTVIIGTAPDSVVMLAKATKDTVAYRAKKKCAKTALQIVQWSCAEVNSDTIYDTLQFVGGSVAYASSPRIDTAYVSTSFGITSMDMLDSVTAKTALPSGYSLNKLTGTITVTAPPDTQSAANYTVIGWKGDVKVDSGTVSIAIVYGPVTIDSVFMDSAYTAEIDTIYGRHFGVEVDSLTLTMGGETMYANSCTNTKIAVVIPSGLTVGWYDLIVTDGTTADTLLNAIWARGDFPQCTLSITRTPTASGTVDKSVSYDSCGNDIPIGFNVTTSPGGYSFVNWTRSGSEVTIADSTNASTTATLSSNGAVVAHGLCTDATMVYTPTALICTVGVTIANIDPAKTGTIDSITVSPAAPDGLTFTKTGINAGRWSGTPTTTQSLIAYTMTSHNCGIDQTDGLDITIIDTTKDSIISCYPRNIRSDKPASQRMISVKYLGGLKATTNSIIHLGGASLGQNESYTDSTVVDTVYGCPSGYYRAFITDPAFEIMSDTLLNALRVLTPSGTIINP
jgi:hypothetical protein